MATSVSVTVIIWLLSPILSFLVNNLLSCLDFNLSRKLSDLQLHIIPSLKLILGDVTEQIILRGAKDEDKGDVKTLGELQKDLRSAMYEVEDALDLIEYHRIEKEVVGDRNWVLRAIDDRIAYCKGSSSGQKLWQCAQNLNQKLRYLGDKLQQCAQDLDLKFWDLVAKLQLYAQNLNQMFRDLPLRAKLVQCVQSLHMYIHQGAAGQPATPDAPAAEFRDDVEQGTATPSPTPDDAPSTTNPLMPNALSIAAGSATEFRGDNQHGSAEAAPTLDAPLNLLSLLQKTWDCFGFVFSLLRSFYLVVRHLRDWSYEAVGIKNDDDTATDWVLSINEIISLRKRIKNIEHIVSESNKSPLLNKSSSSTPKDADKESSSEQKEIDKLYRSIEKKIKVFGRDKVRADISRMLREGQSDTYAASSSTSKPYSVIGIYGIAGSGKSTLAQYVCDYEKGQGHFNLIMFIHVGKTFSVGDIFRDMLYQIKQQQASDTEDPNESQKTELKDLTSLKVELEKELQDKCFLLVLDDLWVNADNMKERQILLDVLNAGQSGSRILVTAQKKDAAAALGVQEQMHIPIPDLEEEQYLSMFMHYALEVSQVTSTDYGRYKAVGRKITKKLHRSPIAARIVAARLHSNNSIDFWETIANLDVLDETMGALWWSYQQLGVDIRRCFTYCSIFPKAYRLEREKLVGMWIAQGYVNTTSNATEELEDIGQSYFEQLLTFSFLQVPRTIYGEEIGEFTIHDLLHELAERVSGSEFFRIGFTGSPENIPQGVRHVFIETNNGAEMAEKIMGMKNLRTLIINEDPYTEAPEKTIYEPYYPEPSAIKRNHDLEKVLGRLFMRLTKLRVLIFKCNKHHTNELSVPASIDHMKHLRYLGFRIHGAARLFKLILPSTFSKLYHIQTIDIPCFRASGPQDMANLVYLRHISDGLSFPNIGRLTSLQRYPTFSVKEAQGYGLKQLKHLNKLRGTLSIRGLEIVGSKEEALEAHLTHKERLRKLVLLFGRDKRFGPDVKAEVLEGLCPPKDLQELEIYYYMGSRYPTWMLSRHHSDIPKQLHKLKLFDCSQLASIPEDSELFIGLRELSILYCDWDSLPENMERLVSLQTLVISGCHKMELLPRLPQALKKTNIGIMDCPRLEFIWEKEKRLEACTSLEYCQDTAPTGTPEQSPYPMIHCPGLVTLEIRYCANLVTLPNLPPSLKKLSIRECGELCSVSGQLGQLEKLKISKCNKLQSVDSLGDASSLETLFLYRCQCLASLGSSGGPSSYLALWGLWIKYCPAMDMKQFNKNVLDGLVHKKISDALSSNPDERMLIPW